VTEDSKPADPVMERYRAVRAQKRAFAADVEPIRPDLYRYCRSLTGCVWDAEDLLQDTLLRAFAGIGEAHGGVRALRPYLFRTATNAWIDEQRRRAPAVMPAEDLPETAADDAPPALEVRDALAELARRLPPQERVALLLKDVFDFPLADVAAALRTTEGAVKSALARARGKLRDGSKTPTAAAVAARGPSARLADAFADAFTRKDVARLVALMAEGGATDILGVVRDLAESEHDGTFVHTLRDQALLRGERRELFGEPIVVLWYSVDEDGRRTEAVRDVMRFDEAGGRCARMRSYYFSPEAMAEIGRELGVPVRTNGSYY
jgi:RNA polymerase sigma-70 factor (ECF subfamily)